MLVHYIFLYKTLKKIEGRFFSLLTTDENIQELGVREVHPVGRKDHIVKNLMALSKAGSQPFPEASIDTNQDPHQGRQKPQEASMSRLATLGYGGLGQVRVP